MGACCKKFSAVVSRWRAPSGPHQRSWPPGCILRLSTLHSTRCHRRHHFWGIAPPLSPSTISIYEGHDVSFCQNAVVLFKKSFIDPVCPNFSIISPSRRQDTMSDIAQPPTVHSTEKLGAPALRIDLIVGALGLVLTLAAVVVAVLQFRQSRASKSRQTDPEQNNFQPPTGVRSQHASDHWGECITESATGSVEPAMIRASQ